jgi:hypothetical protein
VQRCLLSHYISDFQWPQQIADYFTLSSGQNILADIHWFGTYEPTGTAPTDDFTIRIFGDLASAPLYEIAVGDSAVRTDIGPLGDFESAYEYSLDIDPIALLADTTYWLSIINDWDNWGWRWSADSGNSLGRFDDADEGWIVAGTELAFNLTGGTGTVSLPTTLALFGIGLAGLGWSRRKKI